MTTDDLGRLVIWIANRIICFFKGHTYLESWHLPDGSIATFQCELCLRCDTPNNTSTRPASAVGTGSEAKESAGG